MTNHQASLSAAALGPHYWSSPIHISDFVPSIVHPMGDATTGFNGNAVSRNLASMTGNQDINRGHTEGATTAYIRRSKEATSGTSSALQRAIDTPNNIKGSDKQNRHYGQQICIKRGRKPPQSFYTKSFLYFSSKNESLLCFNASSKEIFLLFTNATSACSIETIPNSPPV